MDLLRFCLLLKSIWGKQNYFVSKLCQRVTSSIKWRTVFDCSMTCQKHSFGKIDSKIIVLTFHRSFSITSMLVTNIEYIICWCKLQDVGNSFCHFGDKNQFSFLKMLRLFLFRNKNDNRKLLEHLRLHASPKLWILSVTFNTQRKVW